MSVVSPASSTSSITFPSPPLLSPEREESTDVHYVDGPITFSPSLNSSGYHTFPIPKSEQEPTPPPLSPVKSKRSCCCFCFREQKSQAQPPEADPLKAEAKKADFVGRAASSPFEYCPDFNGVSPVSMLPPDFATR